MDLLPICNGDHSTNLWFTSFAFTKKRKLIVSLFLLNIPMIESSAETTWLKIQMWKWCTSWHFHSDSLNWFLKTFKPSEETHVNNRSSPGSLLYSGNSACASHRCTVATSAAQYNIPSLNLTIFTSNIQFATVFEEFHQKIIGFTCIKLINFPSAATRWGFLRNVTRRSRPLMCKALLEEKHFD